MTAQTCAGCEEPLDATTAVFAVTHFGPLGESPVGGYATCSIQCLLDLALDLRKEIPA